VNNIIGVTRTRYKTKKDKVTQEDKKKLNKKDKTGQDRNNKNLSGGQVKIKKKEYGRTRQESKTRKIKQDKGTRQEWKETSFATM